MEIDETPYTTWRLQRSPRRRRPPGEGQLQEQARKGNGPWKGAGNSAGDVRVRATALTSATIAGQRATRLRSAARRRERGAGKKQSMQWMMGTARMPEPSKRSKWVMLSFAWSRKSTELVLGKPMRTTWTTSHQGWLEHFDPWPKHLGPASEYGPCVEQLRKDTVEGTQPRTSLRPTPPPSQPIKFYIRQRMVRCTCELG